MNAPNNITIADPITDLAAIAAIKTMLADHPRNLALFVFGINSALRASDLSRLTVGEIRKLGVGDTFTIRLQKSARKAVEGKKAKPGKCLTVSLNKAMFDAAQPLIAGRKDGALLFANRDGGRLCTETIGRMVKGWCHAVGLHGRFSSHTLRKTCGYHAFHTFGHSIEYIAEAFGHEDARVTRRYLGLRDDKVKQVFMDEL